MTSPEAVFAQIANRPGAAWLDGGAHTGSVLAWDPVEVWTGAADWVEAGRRLTAGSGGAAAFSGGCLGYVGYGPAPMWGEAAPGGSPEPPAWLGRYAGGACWDDVTGWSFGGSPGFVADARRLVASASELAPPPPPARLTTTTTSSYPERIGRILAWIDDGDCYQVNLTRAVHAQGADPDPWPAYRRLRAASDAAFGAFLRLAPELAVLSNSPEELLGFHAGVARSEPIKGTRPRDPARDAELVADLLASPKERAELAMIVDLVRNDLGRVASPGSVRVGPRRVVTHANVHHTSRTVDADVRPDLDAWDTLASLFPAGSITGAPKRRAYQRISELEEEPRGVYCGAIGYASGDRARWSVAIRTAVQHGDALRWHVGGGIVAGADPAAEWAETEAKERALAASLGGITPRRG